MQRFISCSIGALALLWIGTALAAENEKPIADDVTRRFHQASLRVAEAELKQSQEANKKVPGSVTATELRRLELTVEKARVQLAMAESQPARVPASDKDAEAKIRKALDEKTELQFKETPLQDIVEFLGEKHNLRVRLDKKALDDAGLGSDTPITISLSGISLRSALKLMLKEFDLTYVIENEVLLITTLDEAGQKLSIQVYDVKDLVTSEIGADTESLMETLTTNVAPTTWDEVGGPGSLSTFMGMLVISQTAAVHEEVVALLTELRRMRDARPAKAEAADVQQADPKAVSVKVYKIAVPMVLAARPATTPAAGVVEGVDANASATASNVAGALPIYTPNPTYLEELMQAIPALVHPEAWEGAGGAGIIHALPADASGMGQLLVRQTAEVHAQLQRFLNDLPRKENNFCGSVHGFGGMGGGFF